MKTQMQASEIMLAPSAEKMNIKHIDQLVLAICNERNHLSISPELQKLYQELGEDFLHNTVQGHGLRKPFGYAGDYLMIDMIYTQHTSDKPEYRIWDEYFHSHAAPKAVRNRKAYFKKLVLDTLKNKKSVSMLNVGSGPARDLAEVYGSLPSPQQLHTTCVEMDSYAIAYAKELNRDYLPFIRFEKKNALRFHCEQNFSLIWSAGLFDYFNDKVFVSMLRRFKCHLKPQGEIVIGNFNEDHNPSRNYMEVFGEWFLYHRTREQLIRLAKKAGFEDRQISVDHEAENVNLFLHIKFDSV